MRPMVTKWAAHTCDHAWDDNDRCRGCGAHKSWPLAKLQCPNPVAEKRGKSGKVVQLPAERFGKRTVIGDAGRTSGGHVLARVRCDCGTEDVVRFKDLRAGRARQCRDCANKEQQERTA